ncbi:hypothetical protein OFC37_32435, partial [Escherichia coli]|nr:hypothetical protein [Escherichia coli]
MTAQAPAEERPAKARRGRKSRAEAAPEVLPPVAEPTDPVLLEVPKQTRRGRKPRAAALEAAPEPAPVLPDVPL